MKSGLLGIVIAAVALVLYWSVYILTPTEQAIVLQFGEVKAQETEPGLKFKMPWQNVIVLDKRILDLNMPPLEAIVADKKRLKVDAFARYRITNPVRFYQSVNNVNEGSRRLATFLQSSLRSELAKATFTQVVRDERSALMETIRQDVDKSAAAIGIDVIDVKIRRADLPEANSQAIFRRMQTERQREATEIRAQGEEQSRRIKSRADRDATVLVAEAQRDADIIRGDGDAGANQIFAKAYGEDPSFFQFYRSMQAYTRALGDGNTSLVLSPDSDFFRYFNDPSGKGNVSAAGAGQ
ncbi:protease modulator HflC [Pseudovibrio sp. Tun.PSC04-5.I4]|uniref:protease modulator HflC n=1 Tax=Pseudovibrio sp. Tun.PSC04-5.I4 TaxID=1798213 RepID=UPI00088339EC|nr:protease modulator HflC [Pseudovibrio sp. Tun.PSC04-5.I4]SDR36129.1 membrane protease subunit HflC [Pseudovibrio sp. Tun.PSC04-5.I4]